MQAITQLITFHITMLCFNTVVSIVLWRSHRERLYGLLALYWSTALVSGGLISAVKYSSPIIAVVGFLPLYISSFFAGQLVIESQGRRFPAAISHICFGTIALASVLACWMGAPEVFAVSLAPLANSVPAWIVGYLTFVSRNSKSSVSAKGMTLMVIALSALTHSYPFERMREDDPVILFISLFNFMFAVFATSTVTEKIASEKQSLESQKKWINALEESEARFRSMVANVPGTLVQLKHSMSAAGISVIYASAAIEELFELAPQNVVQNSELLLSQIFPKERALILSWLMDAKGDDQPFFSDIKITTPSGKSKYIHFAGRKRRAADGASICDSFLTDITGRKALEHEVQQTANRLIHTTELANLGAWRMHLGTGEMEWSAQAAEILDISAGMPRTGESFFAQIHPEDVPASRTDWETFLKDRKYMQREWRMLAHDGQTKYVKGWMDFERDEGQLSDYAYGAIQDVTDNRTAEDLRADKKVAEEANISKSMFLANISHELRTPMHGILSFSRFGLASAALDLEDLKSYFQEIYQSGERLMSLLDDLLDLSKLEAGKMDHLPDVVDLNDVCEATVSEMCAFAKEKQLKIQFESNGSHLTFSDQKRVAQVLRNLVSNAIKFSNPDGEIQISIAKHEQSWLCSVSNIGVGIPESEIERIFDKFVQSTRTRTGAGGTGLGLSICREIIHQHGGRIWAESKPGGRTEFKFTLQTYVEDAVAAA